MLWLPLCRIFFPTSELTGTLLTINLVAGQRRVASRGACCKPQDLNNVSAAKNPLLAQSRQGPSAAVRRQQQLAKCAFLFASMILITLVLMIP